MRKEISDFRLRTYAELGSHVFLDEILRRFSSFLIAAGDSILGCPKDALLRMTTPDDQAANYKYFGSGVKTPDSRIASCFRTAQHKFDDGNQRFPVSLCSA